MITLFQFPRAKTIPNFSPFCLKLETWLRLAGLKYENKFVMNPAKSPKGKLPIIKLDGQTYTDSELIIDFLKQQYQITLDDHLSPEQLAQHYADEILFTERLAWLMVYFRWQDDEGWARTRPLFFRGIPFPMNHLVAGMVRKRTIKTLYGQGLGRHSKQELLQMADKTLSNIASILGDNLFFGGEKPATVDASAFGCLANIILSGLDIELRNIAAEHPNIHAYCMRIKEQFYSDFA